MAGPPLAARLAQILDRAARLLAGMGQKAGGIWWPVGPTWGNGDRGPPGTWQRNLHHHGALGPELIAFSAVYACINVIASDISKLPVVIYGVDLTSGARTLRRLDYYAGLMSAPNSYQTHADFMYCFVQSYLFQGNTYCLVRRNARSEINEMHVLNPYRVVPMIAEDGSVFYRCGEDFLAGIAGSEIIPERDIIHHRLPLVPGFPLVGVTPIYAAAASSAVGLKILQNSQQFFSNASRPSGMLVSELKIPDPEADRFKAKWEEAYRGEAFGKVALLSGGLKWEPLTITAQDAQLIEQLRWSVEDVARVFRVPPFMLGEMTKVSYRNNEQLVRAYLTGCLAFHIQALEERFSRAFEFGPTFEFKFDLASLLRTEIDVRFTAYAQALNAGWQSINEVRAQEGLEPVPGGEEPRVQIQYVPLSDATTPEPAPEPALPVPEPTPSDQQLAADASRVRALVRTRLRRAA